jgi:AraC-like DNA-binding protein
MNLLIEISFFLGILVILILLFFQRKNKNRNNYFLMLTLFSSLFSLTVNQLNVTRQIFEFPFLIRTGNVSAYLIFPFLYIYTRNTFYPGRFWGKLDYLLLAPALFYIIDFLPFFLSGADHKIEVMRDNLEKPQRLFETNEGWISMRGFHFLFKYYWGIVIMAFIFRLIFRNRKIDFNETDTLNRPLFWFIIILNLLHLPLIIPGVFGAIFHASWFSLSYMNLSLAVVIVASALYILFSPSILYGFLPLINLSSYKYSDHREIELRETEKLDPNATKLHDVKVSEADILEIVSKIESLMQIGKPYVNPQYSIHDLSQDLNVPVYQLSPIINQYYQSNFSSWLNRYRVAHFIQLCGTHIREDLKLDAIAKESGFANRTTFTNAFKKEKGTTPGRYIKSLPISQ